MTDGSFLNPDFWKRKSVFVTGASGLVGSWLVKELLARGAGVTALVLDEEPASELFRSGDIKKITAVYGMLEDYLTLARAMGARKIDTVFHLGAQTIVGTANRFPLPTFETNIRGTANLLEACRLHTGQVKRVLIASSDKAYGDQDVLPYTEDMPLRGGHPYDVSKSCTDLLAQAYWKTYGLPVAVARCGNIFGGGDLNWSRIVPGTICSLLRRERPVIRSDGRFIRDYVYVKDVVRAYLELAQALEDPEVKGQAFNFSNEKPIDVLGIVEAIRRSMGCMEIEPVIENKAPGEIRDQYLSAEKSRKVLGWKPAYDLESGLKETVVWYRRFLEGQGRD